MPSVQTSTMDSLVGRYTTTFIRHLHGRITRTQGLSNSLHALTPLQEIVEENSLRGSAPLFRESSTTYLESWSGLSAWRRSGSNENRGWGPGKLGQPCCQEDLTTEENDAAAAAGNAPKTGGDGAYAETHATVGKGNVNGHTMGEKNIGCCREEKKTSIGGGTTCWARSLAECGKVILETSDPYEKARLTHEAWRAFLNDGEQRMPIGFAEPPPIPARPRRPELVPPRQIPTMKETPLPLNVYTLHNLTHVELNAIDLAWDTVTRFSWMELPVQFYADFARVADDESRHLLWCLQRLEELGYAYGCMPAHNLLWEGCKASSGHVTSRLAVVPMAQEARGLDAGERLASRLVGWGDNRSASIVSRIAEEEKAHVAVGVSWFTALCAVVGVDPGEQFQREISDLCPDLLRPPFHHVAREEVGMVREWYDASQRGREATTSGSRSSRNSKGGRVNKDKNTACRDPSGHEDDHSRLKTMDIIELRARLTSLLAEELAITKHA